MRVIGDVQSSAASKRRSTRAEWDDFVHTGPGTLAGRYLRRFWQPAYRAQDLLAGRAVPIRIMSEDLTLYRGESALPLGEGGGESGKPHLLAFRCAHPGTQLSTGLGNLDLNAPQAKLDDIKIVDPELQ